MKKINKATKQDKRLHNGLELTVMLEITDAIVNSPDINWYLSL